MNRLGSQKVNFSFIAGVKVSRETIKHYDWLQEACFVDIDSDEKNYTFVYNFFGQVLATVFFENKKIVFALNCENSQKNDIRNYFNFK